MGDKMEIRRILTKDVTCTCCIKLATIHLQIFDNSKGETQYFNFCDYHKHELFDELIASMEHELS